MKKSLARLLSASVATLLFATTTVNAQVQSVVSGTVRTEAGEPLPSATVAIPSLKAAVLTRSDGGYRIVLPADASGTLEMTVRRLGYKETKATITVATLVQQDFKLEASAPQLTGIIVTALSLQREKSTIGTSQQQVTSTDLNRTHDPNIVNQLSGKVSGVQITGGGNIGGSSRIVIRGASSINGNNQPLFVIDGIPVANTSNNSSSTANANGGYDFGNAIQDLNPDDIASITVLVARRDPSLSIDAIFAYARAASCPSARSNTCSQYDQPSSQPTIRVRSTYGARQRSSRRNRIVAPPATALQPRSRNTLIRPLRPEWLMRPRSISDR